MQNRDSVVLKRAIWRVFYRHLVDFIFRHEIFRILAQTNTFPPQKTWQARKSFFIKCTLGFSCSIRIRTFADPENGKFADCTPVCAGPHQSAQRRTSLRRAAPVCAPPRLLPRPGFCHAPRSGGTSAAPQDLVTTTFRGTRQPRPDFCHAPVGGSP